MSGVSFIFPGQGSQHVGMGKAIHAAYPEARKIFDEASDAAGLDMAKLCFDGPEEELNRTENTQPAILTVSLAVFEILKTMHVHPESVAGHSLGELTAVAAAGGISVRDAVSLAKRRGRYMQEAVPEGRGLMAAVLGMEPEKIREACSEASSMGVVAPANFNSPGQVVIAGERDAVEKAEEICKAMGAKKVILLSVSVPSHCILMQPAADRLKSDLDSIEISDLEVPLAANASGSFINRGGDVKAELVAQLTAPLLWEDCISALVREGARVIVEVGPGRVLSGLVKRISKDVEARHVEDETTLFTTLDHLSIGCKFSPKK